MEVATVFFSSAMGSPKGFLAGFPSFQLERFPNLTPGGRRGSHIPNPSPSTSSQWPPSSRSTWDPSGRHNRHRGQLILIQNLFDYRVKMEPKTAVESHAVDRYTFCERLVHVASTSGITKARGIASRGSSSSGWERPSGWGNDWPVHLVGPNRQKPQGTPVPPPRFLRSALQ
ncbi:hypothetical protein Cgig2_024079 [Carnegiea gigantea]|uniref:Uncharacterized protein n=1 Tax=Carnegiea gigantea TaxID=171969 RepID=A0A9Q1QEK8_9CARY|nr:hypothetical protein Cgig2_024079 [Carnegiea gigantea]